MIQRTQFLVKQHIYYTLSKTPFIKLLLRFRHSTGQLREQGMFTSNEFNKHELITYCVVAEGRMIAG